MFALGRGALKFFGGVESGRLALTALDMQGLQGSRVSAVCHVVRSSTAAALAPSFTQPLSLYSTITPKHY
jgi:hypothetical protein